MTNRDAEALEPHANSAGDTPDLVVQFASDYLNDAIATFVLDGAGRRTNIIDALGNQTQMTLDPNGNIVLTTRVEVCTISGVTTSETFISGAAFDCMNRPIITMKQGADGSFSDFWLAALDCANSSSTLFTFIGYDSRDNQTNLVDPKLNTSLWDFDGANRKLRDKRHLRPSGDGSTPVYKTVLTQTGFDADSNLTRMIDDNGGVTQWAYDNQDREEVMTFHDGSTRTNVFNPASDIVGYTDENGSVFDNTFDVLGRKIAVAISPANGVAGNPATIVGGSPLPGTIAQSFEHDGLRRLTFARDSVGTFSVSGATTDCDCAFFYDSIGRKVDESQTLSSDTRYTTNNAFTSYPATQFTFPNSRQINIGYDALYRKNAINETAGGASIAAWNFFGGRTATLALGNGIVTTFMNDAGTSSAVQPTVPNPAWGDITTDHLGYDGSGRLIGKRHKLTSGATLVGFTTEYDQNSNKIYERSLHAESRSSLYTMDSMDRLLSYQRGVLSPTSAGGWAGLGIDDWATLSIDGWAALGVDAAPSGIGVTTPIALPNTDIQRGYSLDGLGNWRNTGYTPEGGSPETELRTHNKLNQITAFGVAPASTPVIYDNGNNVAPNATRGNGNIADDGTRANTWDALNRLIAVLRTSDGLQIAAYVYDAIGRRTLKTVTNGGVTGDVPDGTSRYLFDGQQIVEELASETGSAKIEYVWWQYIDELIQLNALSTIGPQPLSAGTYYLLSDLLYRSAALTNNSAGIVEAYDMDAYGNTLLFSGPGADSTWFTNDDTQATSSACRYVFTGREYDAETGSYFYRLRYYLVSLARFVQRDPAGYQPGLNLYEAFGSSPAIALDPYGLDAGAPRLGIEPWSGDPVQNGQGQNGPPQNQSPLSRLLHPGQPQPPPVWPYNCPPVADRSKKAVMDKATNYADANDPNCKGASDLIAQYKGRPPENIQLNNMRVVNEHLERREAIERADYRRYKSFEAACEKAVGQIYDCFYRDCDSNSSGGGTDF